MKARVFKSILAAFMLLTVLSCEKEVIYDSTVSRTYDIMSRNWQNEDSFFSVDLSVPEITRDVCEHGSVQCFIVYDDGIQTCLPTQRYLSYEYNDKETGLPMVSYYQKMIDFEYCPGTVTLFYTMSDFYYENRPEEMTVRVVVHY